MKFAKYPDNKYRALPFWSLNGKLEEKELRSQLGLLKEMGFGGAFVHSRTGLKTEYMGEEWLRLTDACADECEKLGTDAWLYDEDRWSSGACGGYVTEYPPYRLRFISASITPRDKFDLRPFGDEFIGAFAIKLTGEGYTKRTDGMPEYSGMRLADYFPVRNGFEIPDGWLGMTFKVETMRLEDFYNGYTYLDVMNRGATERFLELTHEKYKKAVGHRFGKSVKGIFTDEPHRGAYLSGFGLRNENKLRMLPFTDELLEAYAEIWDEDIFEFLPELYFATQDDNFSRVTWQYIETLQQLFIANFARPVNEWCKENGIILTGHVLHEDSLSAQTTMSGSVMRYYEHMGYPGIDNLGSNNTCFQAAIAVSSVAKQLGKEFALSELYGCTGWKTTFTEYKQMGDWQAAMGINLRCPHLSWYTMRGEAKRDYPASIGKQANWNKEYRAVEDYFARLGQTLSKAKPTTDALVVMPVESAWGLSHMGTYVDCFGVRCDEYERLENSFRELTERLVYAGVEFDYGDEDMMRRLAKVGEDESGAYLKIGKMKYRSLVLPYMVTVRSSTLEIIADFADAGGKVLVCEQTPTHVDGEKARIKLDLTVLAVDEAVEELCYRRKVHVESDGKFFGSFKKAGNDEYVYFTVNASREKGARAKIVADGEYNVEKFDLRSGETVGIAFERGGGKTVVEYEFGKSEELLLHFTKKKVAAVMPEVTAEEITLDKPAAYKLSGPNALVLDRAKAYVNGEFFDEDETLRLDDKLRDKFGLRRRSGQMLQPWFKDKFFGGGYNEVVCKLKLEFEFTANAVPHDARLMTENYGAMNFSLNGKPIGESAENSDIDSCYSLINIPPEAFVKGRNVLCAECDFGDSFDLENMFILGTFGVREGIPCSIEELPETLALGDVCKQGLPFYAGSVSYLFECENGDYRVQVPEYYGACLKSGDEVFAFAPNAVRAKAENGILEVTAVLTPKNMFGPLHELPALTEVCGPENFRTVNEKYSRDHALIPQGIFSPVKARKIK